MAVERPSRSQWPPSDVSASAVPQSRSSVASTVEATGPLGADLASQTTLAAVLAKIIAAPTTEATAAAILAKLIAAPATEAKQDTLIAAIGAPADAAWDGVAGSATLIAIMKAVWIKLP